MKLNPGFAAISILMGMLGLAACGQNSDQVVYQYPETAVLFDNFHILKTVYTLGEMKLYYRGMNLDGCQIECYDVGRYYSEEELEVGQQPVPARESWTCLCGATNAGKYCMECGISKPQTTLAGPAPAERRTRESSALSAADRFNLSGVKSEK